MKRNTDYTLLLLAIIFFICALCSCNKEKLTRHQCKWKLCPYKGITEQQYKSAVYKYVGDIGTDAYYIDLLHLQFPDLEYEQLENKLFSNN